MPRIKAAPAVILAALTWPGPFAPSAIATTDASGLCTRAATEASRQTGVPYQVLLAIALVETGRNDRPWPWTVNVGGEGDWFDSAGAAEAYAESVIDAGKTNLDLGCFQLNYRWHGAAFASVADMLDPDRNAIYAAEFLANHFQRTGDWAAAAAAYHSATPENAGAYRAKFETAYAGLAGEDLPALPPDAGRQNRFPLLVAGTTGSRGSLVPATLGGTRLIGTP